MGKNKKKSEPTMSKPELSKRLLALMSNHPAAVQVMGRSPEVGIAKINSVPG